MNVVDLPFTPGHPEWCPVGKPEDDEPHMHCTHWENCEPCCRCGDDTPSPECDCQRCTAARPHAHVPRMKGLPGSECAVCGAGFMAGIHIPEGGWNTTA